MKLLSIFLAFELLLANAVASYTKNAGLFDNALLHGSETNKQIAMFCSEALANTMNDLKNESEGVRGYRAGRIFFEAAAIILPFTKPGQILQLTKAKFLTQILQKKVLSTGGRKIAGEMIGKLAKTAMCFLPGTKIKTQDGLRNIEDIHADMMVWSRDEFTGESGWKRVAQSFVTHPTRIHHLTYALRAPPTGSATGSTDTPVRNLAAETLGVTAPHPFWVSSRPQPGFVPAEELQAGDVLSLADGGSAEVTANLTEDAPAGSTFTTYNFEVEDFHTYFAGEAGVWVHNDCPAKDKIASVFFQKAKQLKQGGGGELAGKRFNALLDTKKELIGTHGICETNWREAAKDVSDKMLKDFKDGKIADVAHLPTVEDWNKKYFKDVLKGAKTPDGIEVNHVVPNSLVKDINATGRSFDLDGVPGHAMERQAHRAITDGSNGMNNLLRSTEYRQAPLNGKAELIVQFYQGAGESAQAKVAKSWFQAAGILLP